MATQKTIEHGLWSRTTTTLDINNEEDIQRHKAAQKTNRECVLEGLAHIKAEILHVLARAGFPIDAPVYIRTGPMKYEKISDDHEWKISSVEYVQFPIFPEIEPLSIEDFATRLYPLVDHVSQSLENGVDGYVLAHRMMALTHAYYPFRVELDKIGAAAEAHMKVEIDRKKAVATMKDKNADRMKPVEQFVKQQLNTMSPKDQKQTRNWKVTKILDIARSAARDDIKRGTVRRLVDKYCSH